MVAHGGGLLVAHVVHDALGRRPELRSARDALARALHDTPVEEVHDLRCADGLAVAARIVPVPVAAVPTDLVPVEGTDAFDLRPNAAEHVASIVSRRSLASVDEGLGINERLLVAAGALAVVDGELVATVAGLVAFGRAPWERLGGLHAHVADGRREGVVVGDGPTLPQRIVRALRVREPSAIVVRALVERALIEREWSPFPEDDPILVLRRGDELEVRWPMAEADDVPNRTLRRLLKAAGGLGRLAEGSVRIADQLEAMGGVRVGEEAEGGDTVVRVVLPEEDELRAEVPERRTPPAVAVVRHEVPVRDLVARTPSRVVASAPHATPPTAVPVPVAPPAQRPIPVPAAPVVHVAGADREAAVLALLDTLGQVTSRDVIERLGWTRSTTRDVIARMAATGRIASTAASVRSPFQAYLRG